MPREELKWWNMQKQYNARKELHEGPITCSVDEKQPNKMWK